MYAVDDLSDAVEVTREFLTPVRAGTWLRLALVVFFVGGAGGGFPSFPSGGGGTEMPTQPAPGTGMGQGPTTGEILAAILVLAAIGLVIWLVFVLIGSVMEFVFFESLRTDEVHVRRYSNRNVGKGLRLFAFRVILGLLVVALVGGPFVLFLGGLVGVGGVEGGGMLLGVLLVLFALLVGLVFGVVTHVTSVFVAPIMLLEERGVLSAWRRFWPTFRANLVEYVVYLVLAWILRLAVAFVFGIVAALVAVVVAIPFLVIGVALVAGLGDVGVVLAVPIGIVGLLVVLVAVLLVFVPVETYFRYYALLVLGDTNADLDLIPDQRAAARGDGGRDNGRDGGAAGWDDRGDDDGPDSTDADRWDDDEDDWNW